MDPPVKPGDDILGKKHVFYETRHFILLRS